MARSNTQGASATRTTTVGDEHSTKESFIGTDRRKTSSNVSWGAIFAGVVTFLAVTLLLSLVTAGIGLTGSGTWAGIWSIVTLALALAAGGYVAGALAVRGGLIHGFLTWATSLLTALVLATWLSTSLLGAVGGVVGQAASAAVQATDVAGSDVGEAVDEAQENVDQEDVEAAQQQGQEALDQAAATAETGVWWAFFGMLVGALIAAFAGMAGARSVATPDDEITVATRR